MCFKDPGCVGLVYSICYKRQVVAHKQHKAYTYLYHSQVNFANIHY